MTQRMEDLPARFTSKIVIDANGCWLWIAALTTTGYGNYGVDTGSGRKGWRIVRAHRYSYELLVGPIPDGLELDHLCRVPRCVNPAHLEPVDHQTNVLRGYQARGPKSRCKNGHLLAGANLYIDPNSGQRVCRSCKRIGDRRRRSR